jgi:hypothetical protein
VNVDIPADALGFAVVFAALMGTAFCVKLLVWGKAPIKRLRSGAGDPETDERLAELEQRVEQMSEFMREEPKALES